MTRTMPKWMDNIKRSTTDSLFNQRASLIKEHSRLDNLLESDTISAKEMERIMKKQFNLRCHKREIERELMSRNVEWSVC